MPITRMTAASATVGLLLGFGSIDVSGQQSAAAFIPHPSWDCYIPDGIPVPERGNLIFEIMIALERAESIGRTQYGERHVAVGREGTVSGRRLSAEVMAGALDLELTLANGTIEIEQILVLQAADGSYILARNAGVGSGANDVRVVMDFEAPNESEHAWLNTGHYIARRHLDASTMTLSLQVYDAADAASNAPDAIEISKPAGVPPQPWAYREKSAGEREGEVLIEETVTLAPSQLVGDSKRGPRNIIPITGGELRGRIDGRVLMGGADYQDLSPPATIDARYLWQANDGEIIIVRNGGSFGSLAPTFEARVDGPWAFLNSGRYLSSNPAVEQGAVSLTFYHSE